MGSAKPNSVISVAGVVREISVPSVTKKRGSSIIRSLIIDYIKLVDLSVTVLLADPSNHTSSGFRINCFTKKHKEWLPSTVVGEVLLFRCVKVKKHEFC